ncbi:hypothetical protein NDN08_001824 [Rhodosorus marinus]|uniref:NADP-dependent oxidoreductase domain-containing protein n=1 Tax=Rhodosorus marinus TaxID=101924 RepID=A0AAV8UW87_9RHOD|nr:hypothetical protein NDN08_001824 [Rhodosorus marinus]
MQYKYLGRSGLKVSRLSFGSWVTFKTQVDVDKAYELMKVAYKSGINFFDNAEVYANGDSERLMGLSVKKGIEDKVWDRNDLVISTKLFFGYKARLNNVGLSRKHIIEGCNDALGRMSLDYVDIVFAHRHDPFTPMDEIVRAFNYLIDTGKTFYWATSEWPVERIMEACEVADKLNLAKPIADQCEYNLIVRDNLDKAYHPVFEKFGYGTTIWSPLASGVLTGKYLDGNVPEGSRLSLEGYEGLSDRYMTPGNLEKVAAMKPIAERLGCNLAQLSLGFCYVNPHVSTVILGATSTKQLEENLATLKIVEKLTPEVLQEIEDIWQNKPGPNRIDQMVSRARA